MSPNQLSEELVEFLEQDSTIYFLAAANRFINIIESKEINKQEFIYQSREALADLYATGVKLEGISLRFTGADVDFDRDSLFENKNNNLVRELGHYVNYWEVFDPVYDKNEEPSQGWLVDDYADIYRDLKIEMEKMKIGTNEAVEDALWQLKFSFNYHWGSHCINALRYLHYLLYDNKELF